MSGSSGQRLADPFKRATYNSLSDHDDALGRGTDDESAAAAHSPAAELSQRRNGVSVIKAQDPQADQADRASGAALRSAARAGCSPRTMLPSMLPVLEWLPSYQVRTQLLGDIIAGLTVGMMVIPQGLGYASVATVPKVYGLYSAFMAPIVYAVVGGCKDVSVGPTAILSLLTAQAAHGDVGLTVQITMLCGLFQMALGMFNLGVLVDFISTPVLSGFTSAASVQIILTQIGSLCGYKLRTKVYFAFYDLFHDIGKIRVADLFLGLGCMVVLWFLGKLRNHRSVYVQQLATGRNAVLVCLGALLSLVVASASSDGVRDVPWRLVGQVPSGLPRVAVPDLSADTLSHSKGDVILIAFVGFLESIAIAKSFAKQNGYAHKLRNSQELFAVGSANVVGSFFGSLPVTGSFSRTAVASQAGAKTPLQGVVTGVVVLVALLILTPAFYYIPTALLASIVIV
jgi:sodium-independent sulfate anion transporter 11